MHTRRFTRPPTTPSASRLSRSQNDRCANETVAGGRDPPSPMQWPPGRRGVSRPETPNISLGMRLRLTGISRDRETPAGPRDAHCSPRLGQFPAGRVSSPQGSIGREAREGAAGLHDCCRASAADEDGSQGPKICHCVAGIEVKARATLKTHAPRTNSSLLQI